MLLFKVTIVTIMTLQIMGHRREINLAQGL